MTLEGLPLDGERPVPLGVVPRVGARERDRRTRLDREVLAEAGGMEVDLHEGVAVLQRWMPDDQR